ncbi:ABC transporter ATP-binding protein [Pseudomonas syringae pv. theae ICMP 3923]|uniref:ABC transporter ATP-binding protein n=1 Tax=Pseudomonas syringae TaxID=317 RepID=UPI0002EAFBD3|nr:ABC transporter ATP-binding protein [Pseudomonas syringae]EPM65417.1 ABC transporter ATP-binding protein [Pseudomonas syringae pv. theae ICMP 3923]KPZ30020.1 hypothetical protein AN901_201790 [Pseudomonas syringae pv. theae]MBL3876072.1 ABC transporter ATP-binding protein [Pseudomonas syringae pv. theae]GKQ33393.1 ABC transporter ATP-binding protein [Pseudomonas syringae pv. theae]GKS08968.1 ABC transporter ATP-binding protein [Pseudomonas syringae pv. theae]
MNQSHKQNELNEMHSKTSMPTVGASVEASAGGSLTLQKINKFYGSAHALKDISLEIKSGEFVALLGPSGCGKTTLLGAIAGFIPIESGKVLINGEKLPKNAPPYDRNLGVVFQHYALFPHMTVRRNIAFPLEVRKLQQKEIDDEVDRVLDLIDLKKFQDRYPSELSGGQQQRVALARALVYAPPLLLLDEPLGALDRRMRDTMQAELMDLHKRLGLTFIYVTHDQDEALAMADRVVVMKDGLIEQCGTPLELYEKPQNEFVAKFVGECNVLAGVWKRGQTEDLLIHEQSGIVLSRSEPDLHKGVSAKVAVRPEWIHVAAGKNVGDQSVFQVSVTHKRFHGSETLYDVGSPLGGLLLRVSHRARALIGANVDSFNVYIDTTETVVIA